MSTMQVVLGGLGWWWVVATSLPFALYSIPFVLGSFPLYRHLTIAALAGRYDIAGLHILGHTRLWQFHVSLGLIYMLVTPFQFNSSFRARHLELHRQMGYAFVCASFLLGVTGSTAMLRYTEFGLLGRIVMAIAGLGDLICLAMAMVAVKQKRIQEHRRWMMRTAVTGFAMVNSRLVLIILQKGFGVPIWTAADYSILVSLTTCVALVEAYIQMYLMQTKKVE